MSKPATQKHQNLQELQEERRLLAEKLLKGEPTLIDCKNFLRVNGEIEYMKSAILTAKAWNGGMETTRP